MMPVYNLMHVPADTVNYVVTLEANEVMPAAPKWSGSIRIPQIGDKINIRTNMLGDAIVESYFVEDGFLGVSCKLLDAPEWHSKRHPAGSKHHNTAMVFGCEIRSIK